MINYRQPQEEIMAYYEIFSKYNQDVKFVGSFERYQREVGLVPENSCTYKAHTLWQVSLIL